MTASGVPAPPTARSALHPAQRILLMAGVGMVLGSFLTWVSTAAGPSFGGFTGAGRFTFYFGVLGIAGGLVPLRWLASVQAVAVGAAGIGFPAWQVVHLVDKVGFGGWVPGTGLIMVFAAGLAGAYAAFQLLSDQTSRT